MAEEDVLAIVLAGGKGSRLDVLTDQRAKPTLPFGGVFSLMDICLSNLVNSRITDVWVVVQYMASTLDQVLAHGRPWDLDRNRGGLRVLPPQQGIGDDEEGMSTGNADALFRIRRMIAEHDPELVMVLSADHVYGIDHRDVIATHRAAGADCTVVTTTIDQREANHHMVVEVGGDGRVTGVEHKPDDPSGNTIATEIFLYDAKVLLRTLEELHQRLAPDADGNDTGLGDFSEHLLPELVAKGTVVAHALDGYWRDLGRPSAYLRAHQDLLDGTVDLLHRRDWPMRTAAPQGAAARVHESGQVFDSMLGDGCEVFGRVERSVIGAGVVVEQGAVVRDSILMRDVRVEPDAEVGWSIVDDAAVVGRGAQVGSQEQPHDEDERLRSTQVTLVGRGVVLGDGVIVSPGSHLAAGTDAPSAS